MKEAVSLIWKDVKSMWAAFLVIAAYYMVGKSYLYSGCVVVMVTGFPCPACGMTRAAFALLRGDFARAFQLNPFIYAIVIFVFAFCVWRYILQKNQRIFVKWGILLIVCMVLFYIYRMVCLFPGEPPMSYYRRNLLATVWEVIQRYRQRF